MKVFNSGPVRLPRDLEIVGCFPRPEPVGS